MRKLSKAQERILRQVADGRVKLVYVGDNDHSVRVWDAVDKDGRKCNQQYDALYKLQLIHTPMADWPVLAKERPTAITITGEELLTKMGPAGKLITHEFARGTGVHWMLRVETFDSRPSYVLYKDDQRYDTYFRLESAWAVFRSHCPYTNDLEASLSR